ncbi:MAG: hypothetical protein MUO77_19415 [Anaerolineales bacterium]|nr:hypothetical protein [Anaerolineales bacterium]
MKKILLFGFLALTVACQSAVSTIAPESAPIVSTQTPPAPFAQTQGKPATVTPTFIPTEVLSPTPSPRFFTENFDIIPPALSIIQTGNEASPQIKAEGGVLTFELDSPYTWTYAICGAHDYKDVRMDASFESRGTSPESIGLVCRYSEQNGWYEFNISTDGTYNLLYGQWMAQGIASYTPIANDTSEYIKPGKVQYELGLVCQQNALWLYINQKLFRKVDVARYGLTEGKVGLAISSFENTPVISAFDWVEVSEP